MIPTDQQIESDASFLGFTDADTKRLKEQARRARTGSTERDGHKSSHGASGGRVSGIGDPVGEMACDDDPVTPEVERQHALLFDMLGQAASSKRAVRNTLERLGGIQQWERPIGQTSTPCKVGPCDSPATKNGFCDTDNRFNLRYIEQHNEPAPIGLLEENARKRQPQKRRQSA